MKISLCRLIAIGAVAATLLIAGCGGFGGGGGGNNSSPNVAVQWDQALLAAQRAQKLGPPQIARAIAIVHTSMFDAWSAYDEKAVGTRLGGTLRRPAAERSQVNKEKAISYAAYRALLDLFPTQATIFNDLMNQLGYDPSDVSTDTTTPSGIGNVTAAALIAYRHADGSNQLGGYADTSGYAPVNPPMELNTPQNPPLNDPNRWQAIKFSTGATPGYVAPHWGEVIPFALTSGAQFRPSAPPPQNGSALFKAQAQEIVDYTANLDDRKKVIAEFWADGPGSELPPGHWMLFAQFVVQRDHLSLDDAVKLFFIVGNGMFDSSIACWDCKRTFDYVRPVTAIRFLFAGQTLPWYRAGNGAPRTIAGELWKPYQPDTFLTPPFAEFTSGHSTFSACGAELLKRFTGSDYCGWSATRAAGSSVVEPGVAPAVPITLSWYTFSDAAAEAGISREYGGIHFRNADYSARAMGRQVAEWVWNRAQTYINGTAPFRPQ